MRNFLREEDGEAALSNNRVLVPGTASIGINIGIDWYSKYWTNIFNTFRDPYSESTEVSRAWKAAEGYPKYRHLEHVCGKDGSVNVG